MRILITGVTGFIGGHLVERLAQSGSHEIFGISRNDGPSSRAASLASLSKLLISELTDTPRLTELLRETRPEWIFHLAGHANPKIETDEERRRCFEDNYDATDSLYTAILHAGLRPRILFASTGHVYAAPDRDGVACHESTPIAPRGVYAESKARAEELSLRRSEEGLEIVRVRFFNQIGPGQSRGFIVPDYASQIAEFEVGIRNAVSVGDLSAWRDFTDVRDTVRALESLMKLPTSIRGLVFNAASGRMWQLQQLFDKLSFLANRPLVLESRNSQIVQTTYSFSSIDSTRLRETTGWKPQIDLDQTLLDTLKYWRSIVKQ